LDLLDPYIYQEGKKLSRDMKKLNAIRICNIAYGTNGKHGNEIKTDEESVIYKITVSQGNGELFVTIRTFI